MQKLKQLEIYKKISEDINNFVKDKLADYDTDGIAGKTIHDPIWGSNEYSKWEMELIDSPLIQRLRNISQVGLAVLTYPAARHSRFEHTLGVAAATKRIVDRINNNCKDIVIKPDVKDKLTLAAIMHDVGHCFYSHLSESIYGRRQDFAKLLTEIKNIYNVKPKPHEVMSLLIVNSKAFKDFFTRKVHYKESNDINRLLEDVGKIIIGVNIVEGTTIYSYQTAILNGNFDVDKLDYIKRDSYTAGLSLDFDIERLFTKIVIKDVIVGQKIEKRLFVQANGVTAIEELTFCKIMLFSYIYYHQKVLITEDIIKDYVQALLELGILNSFADFLKYSESELLALAEKQGDAKPYPDIGDIKLKTLADNLRNRNLPKRCLEISQSIIQQIIKQPVDFDVAEECKKLFKEIHESENYDENSYFLQMNLLFSRSSGSPERYLASFLTPYQELTYKETLNLRKSIYDELCNLYKQEKEDIGFGAFDIYFVMPNIVSYGTTNEKNILGRSGEFLSIDDFVKLDQWASSFNAYKWRGYVYVSSKIKRRDLALKACSKIIFNDKIDLDELKSYLKF